MFSTICLQIRTDWSRNYTHELVPCSNNNNNNNIIIIISIIKSRVRSLAALSVSNELHLLDADV